MDIKSNIRDLKLKFYDKEICRLSEGGCFNATRFPSPYVISSPTLNRSNNTKCQTVPISISISTSLENSFKKACHNVPDGAISLVSCNVDQPDKINSSIYDFIDQMKNTDNSPSAPPLSQYSSFKCSVGIESAYNNSSAPVLSHDTSLKYSEAVKFTGTIKETANILTPKRSKPTHLVISNTANNFNTRKLSCVLMTMV